jgi:hypothetical protein
MDTHNERVVKTETSRDEDQRTVVDFIEESNRAESRVPGSMNNLCTLVVCVALLMAAIGYWWLTQK